MSDPLALARPEIVALSPYAHAVWDPALERLHANELPWRGLADTSVAGLNRYPEPQPHELVAALAELYSVPAGNLLVGRGSDEGIDLLTRAFCNAGRDAVLVCPPTFGMYAVAAQIQGAAVVSVPLRRESAFSLDAAAVIAAMTPAVKLVYLCSPNNPTGNSLEPEAMRRVIAAAAGRALVVIDEAYAEFSAAHSFTCELGNAPHLVVLRTLSKAHGLAGARVGSLIASGAIVDLLRKIIPPYAISQLTVEAAIRALSPPQLAASAARVTEIRGERDRVAQALAALPGVQRVWPSDANFLLVDFAAPDQACAAIQRAGLLVRDQRRQPGLAHALRITIGTPEQNDRLIGSLA